MVSHNNILFFNIETFKKINAIFFPVLKPFYFRSGFTEKLKFHLLKFPCPKSKVTGSNLVSERLAHLAYSERNLFTACPLDVFKIHKNTLSRFRTKINDIFTVFRNAGMSFEHKIKLPYIRKISACAAWTRNFVFINIVFHFLI